MSSALSQTQHQISDFHLSDAEITRFMEDGFVIVRNVFPQELAGNILSSVMTKLKSETQTISSPEPSFVILKKVFYNETISKVFTKKYVEIVDQLCGKGRWEYNEGLGHFFINYPVNEPEWSPVQNGWHVDNNSDHQNINSQSVGLITFHLLTDILAGGGGTAIRPGSHKYSARILSEAGSEGIKEIKFSKRAVFATNHLPFVEITGQVGDVLFMHPLTVHARSLNTLSKIRVIGHKFFHLYEPLNFCRRSIIEHSVIERSTIDAISQIKK